MKILFVGDIHNHMYMFDDIQKLDNQFNFDKIICLGDYVDDWNTTNAQSLTTLNNIILLKKENPDKYTFLLGNHELSYLGFPCSGHQQHMQNLMEQTLTEHIDIFDLYAIVNVNNKEYVCTHAGITNDFINQKLDGEHKWKLNLQIWNENKLQFIGNLTCCSYLRGGRDEFSSFVWADLKEHRYMNLQEKPIIPYQIIGHTPVKFITHLDGLEHNYIFIDTHSTYRDGTSYGDKSYLIWNEDRFISVLNKEV